MKTTISIPAPVVKTKRNNKVQVLKAVARYRKVVNQNFNTLFWVEMVAGVAVAAGTFLELPCIYKPAVIIAACALFSWYGTFIIDTRKEGQL